MVDSRDENSELTRVPTRADLVRIADELNRHGAKYLVLGGMAMMEWGLRRSTMDIDLLIETSAENVCSVRESLSKALPEKAAEELSHSDVMEFVVVRINDEITVDVMAAACGVSYADAAGMIAERVLDHVRIPFASPELLMKTKATYREKDALDRAYLRELIAARMNSAAS